MDTDSEWIGWRVAWSIVLERGETLYEYGLSI